MTSALVRLETGPECDDRWRSWEDGRDRYVYVHRLAAVAWGILDGPADRPDGHLSDGTGWLDVEEAR